MPLTLRLWEFAATFCIPGEKDEGSLQMQVGTCVHLAAFPHNLRSGFRRHTPLSRSVADLHVLVLSSSVNAHFITSKSWLMSNTRCLHSPVCRSCRSALTRGAARGLQGTYCQEVCLQESHGHEKNLAQRGNWVKIKNPPTPTSQLRFWVSATVSKFTPT